MMIGAWKGDVEMVRGEEASMGDDFDAKIDVMSSFFCCFI